MPSPTQQDRRPHAPRSVLVADAGRAREGSEASGGSQPFDDVALRERQSGISEALDDLASALRAYDRLARRLLRDPESRALEVWRASLGAPADAGTGGDGADVYGAGPEGDTKRAGGATVMRQAEAAIVGLADEDGADVAEDLLARGLVRPGGLLYACILDETNGDAAGRHADILEDSCEGAGLTWAGGLVIPASALVPNLLAHPRMGALRRPISETADDLVAAVRSGLTVPEAARRFSWPAGEVLEGRDDLLVVRPTTLSRALAALVRRQERYLRSR